MIGSFRNRALKAFWEKGDAARLQTGLVARIKRRLDALDAATVPEDVNLPSFGFHRLRGKPERFSVHVNGQWCITFGWEEEDAMAVDLENYH